MFPGILPVAKGGTGATTVEGARNALNAAAKTVTLIVTLPDSGWSGNGPYTITLPALGVLPHPQTVLVSPAPEDYAAYAERGIQCVGQGTNELSFEAEELPESPITVNVAILG